MQDTPRSEAGESVATGLPSPSTPARATASVRAEGDTPPAEVAAPPTEARSRGGAARSGSERSASERGASERGGAGPSTRRAPAYPKAVDRLIAELARLPGIGRRSAERMAFHLLRSDPQRVKDLASSILDVKRTVRHCVVCSNLTDAPASAPATPDGPAAKAGEAPAGPLCAVCADETRDRATVLVVEQPKDLIALELTGMYRGIYHVLLGRISPLDGVSAADLTVAELLSRVEHPERNPGGVRVSEVVLGLNPTLEGDGTALYLVRELKDRAVRVSRLARGLPAGSSLEQANKAVLADAIEGRQSM